MRLCQIDNPDADTVYSADDAAMFAGALADGILNGMTVTYGSSEIYVAVGRAICNGRVCVVESPETITAALVPSGEIVIQIDLSDTPGVVLVSRAQTALTRQDTLSGGTIYETQLATYTSNGSSITGLTQTLGQAKGGHAHGNISAAGTIGTEAGRLIGTGTGGALEPASGDTVRAAAGLSNLRMYYLAKNAAASSFDFVKSNWANFAINTSGIIHVNGLTFGSSESFFYQKVNDNYGAALEIGYGVAAPIYHRLNGGVWS